MKDCGLQGADKKLQIHSIKTLPMELCESEKVKCHRAFIPYIWNGEKTGNKDIKYNIKCCICLFLWEIRER